MVEVAKAKGYKKIIGEYLPTAKNGMVADHYTNLGFEKVEGSASAQWELDINNYKDKECYIQKANE